LSIVERTSHISAAYFLSSKIYHNLLLQYHIMDIQFDPFSFGVATFALAVAVMQLYWNRPGAQRQNAVG
jgi:hypothetical protein